MKIKLLPAFLLVFAQTFVFSQSIEDYLSAKSDPWNYVSSWQHSDESSWGTSSINFSLGYPDPYSVAAGAVLIQSGDATLQAPVIETIKPIDCSSSGSVVLSNLPVGNWVINPGGIAGMGISATIRDLAVGFYSFTVTNEFGTISPATEMGSIVITDKSSSTWTDSWSNGIPTINTNVILAGNYDTTKNPSITACSLTIKTGFSLTITDEKFIAIQNDVTVDEGATLNIGNLGALVIISDSGMVANNGTIKVNKTTAPSEKTDAK